MKILLRYRRIWAVLSHLCLAALSLMTAFLLRFDFSLPRTEIPNLQQGLLIALSLKMLIFWSAGLDRGWWRYAGLSDAVRLLAANVIASLAFAGVAHWWTAGAFPRSVYCIDFLLCFLTMASARLLVRAYNEAFSSELRKGGRRILIYGGGAAGVALAREIRTHPEMGYEAAGFLDDSAYKRNSMIMGIPVLGFGRQAAVIVERQQRRGQSIDEIIIAMPSASGRQMREALANCRAAGVACKTIPGLGELLKGKILTEQIRNVSLEDLLGREPVRLEEDRIREHIKGRSVLVTGAAGSIGSELCRQIAGYLPQKLILFDQAESDLYKIDLELRSKYPALALVPAIGDICEVARVEEVFEQYAPDSVFHAAAYKHVPMMEAHVAEAMKNNVLGTWNLVQAAQAHGCANFLMISSDKAVNPSSIMGATKRVAEVIVSAMPRQPTRFVSVRFGNVLGSNGSVVPLFQAQIASGGPVTVTHPEIRRYFMITREAVQLVLQASTMGRGSEVFVLDMGEPIRIADLARNMIRLAGHVPDEEIEIRYVGLRPGEKLVEELAKQNESLVRTEHDQIRVFSGPRATLDFVDRWIEKLRVLLAANDKEALVLHLKRAVPEYSGVFEAAATASPSHLATGVY